MPDLKETLKQAEEEARASLARISSVKEWEEVRVRCLGKKGVITRLLSRLGELDPEQRPEAGRLANTLKKWISEELERCRSELLRQRQEKERGDTLDVTLPGRKLFLGSRHPLTQVLAEIEYIFRGLGFATAEGPEVETEYYNFEALNTPADHPARDEQDSFYLAPGVLLRTQTSPVQIRVMEKQSPPVRVICPGKCYRRDARDASHTPMFHQVEGLMVDREVTFADLKGVLEVFARRMFGPQTRMRFRPDFFPFTEPSAEASISCVMCEGKGCSVCKQTGWLEILGAGMVDPAVFAKVGYDPEEFVGFAFGMGVERIAMLKYGIDDIRLFFDNDVRFLSQF